MTIKHVGESQKRTAEMKAQYGHCKGMANGGRVKAYPEMSAGAASGVGRLEKIGKEPAKTTHGRAAEKEMAGMERAAKRKGD